MHIHQYVVIMFSVTFYRRSNRNSDFHIDHCTAHERHLQSLSSGRDSIRDRKEILRLHFRNLERGIVLLRCRIFSFIVGGD